MSGRPLQAVASKDFVAADDAGGTGYEFGHKAGLVNPIGQNHQFLGEHSAFVLRPTPG